MNTGRKTLTRSGPTTVKEVSYPTEWLQTLDAIELEENRIQSKMQQEYFWEMLSETSELLKRINARIVVEQIAVFTDTMTIITNHLMSYGYAKYATVQGIK